MDAEYSAGQQPVANRPTACSIIPAAPQRLPMEPDAAAAASRQPRRSNPVMRCSHAPNPGAPLKARLPWILAALLALAAVGWGVWRSANPAPAVPTRAQAVEQLTELGGRFSAAVENRRSVQPMLGDVQAIADQFPDLHSAHQLLGQIQAQLGETRDAYAAFERALQLQPADAELQNLAGTAAAVIGDLEAAEAHFRLAIAQDPDDARFHIRLGDTMLKTQRLDDAHAAFRGALTLRLMAHAADAGLADVSAARALIADDAATRADLLRQAIAHTETALSKLPPDEKPETLAMRTAYARKLARHHHRRGDANQACAIVETLPEDDRFDPAVLAEWAIYLNARGQPVVAALQYELAAQRDPTNPELLARGAHWFEQAGDGQAARLLRERLRARWPDHPAAADPRDAAGAGDEAPGG